ncbi:MAG: STT3 domain-containing protein [Myxococcota bacterium]
MTGASATIAASRAPVFLFLFAFAIRCIPAPRLFGETVPPFGTDAYYHLRRVLFTLENPPAILGFDRYINFPHGGQPIWPPVFDWLLALVAWPVHAGGDPASALRVESWLAWLPPILGAATVVLLYFLARRLFDPTTALVSAGILSLLSGHYWYSQIGFVDHHAAVALLSTGLLVLAVRLLDGMTEGRPGSLAAATGVTLGALLLVWPGGLLHVLVLETALLFYWGTRNSRPEACRAAMAAAVVNAVAVVVVAPFGIGQTWTNWSDFSPAVLSHFQPWLFSALAIHAAACAAIWRGTWGSAKTQRIAQSLAIGAALLLLSVWLIPALTTGAVEALRWLLKEETFQAVVVESKPLFADGTTVAEARLSRFVYLVPLAALALAWLSRGASNRPALRLVVLQVVVLGAVTLLQRRFFNTFSVMVALCLGWTLVALFRAAQGRGAPRWATGTAVVTAAIWLLLPVLESYRLPLRNLGEVLAGRSMTLPTAVQQRRSFAQAAVWLRENSPPTAGFLDAAVAPEYGVLAFWTHGHLVEYVARRPSIVNNFGDDLGGTNFLESYRFFQAGDAEAREIGSRLGVRYVLMRTKRNSPAPDSMAARMSARTPDIDFARLVYDEPVNLAGDRSRIRVFELHE